jgi:iron complex transport system substrate-binding protein
MTAVSLFHLRRRHVVRRALVRLSTPVLVLVFVLSLAPTLSADPAYPLASTDQAIQDALDYLRAQQAGDGSIGGYGDSGWACIAIAAAGEDPTTWTDGGASLIDYLKAGHPDITGEFNMGTYLARMVLVALAADEDPTAFGSWGDTYMGVTITNGDYLGALMSLYDGTQFLMDLTGDPDSARTLNDDFWGLRAVVLAGESATSTMVQNVAQHIIDYQESDGGWTWGTPDHSWYALDSTDVDNTAAAVVALALSNRGNSLEVMDAIDFLHTEQDAGGGFSNDWAGVNVQSTAWAVDGIGATRRDPTGVAWMPAGSSPVDYLLDQQQVDGSFGSSAVRSTSDVIVALMGQYYRAPSPTPVVVGGEALAVNKLALVLPWLLALMGLVVAAAGVWNARRDS